MPPPTGDGKATEETTECFFSGYKVQRTIFSEPRFPSPVPKPQEPCHKIAPSFGGLGLFATRDLSLGDLIYAERPLFIASFSQNCLVSTEPQASRHQKYLAIAAEIEKDLRIAIDRMQPERRAALLALSDTSPNQRGSDVRGILQTNYRPLSFDLATMNEASDDGDEDLQYGMILNQLSRVNHSCVPNAAITFSLASFSAQLHAIRDIKEGEEVFINYCRCTLTPEKRQEALADYSFTCTCPGCLDPENPVNVAAALLSQFQLPSQYKDEELFYVLPDSQPNFTELLERSKKLVAFIEKSGLQITGAYDAQLKAVATAAWHLGDDETVLRYLDLRQRWTRAVRGKEIVYSRDRDGELLLNEPVFLRPL